MARGFEPARFVGSTGQRGEELPFHHRESHHAHRVDAEVTDVDVRAKHARFQLIQVRRDGVEDRLHAGAHDLMALPPAAAVAPCFGEETLEQRDEILG